MEWMGDTPLSVTTISAPAVLIKFVTWPLADADSKICI